MAAIEVDQFLARPPDQVWQALTDPDLLARWLMPNDFRPAVGHRFTFRTEPVPAHGLMASCAARCSTWTRPGCYGSAGGADSWTPW